jgi:PRTRC genetic system protein E
VFTELKKLIAKRSLTITVAVLDNEQIRVNVVPHARPEDKKANESIKYSSKNEVPSVPEEAIKALTTPISITGTAEEIDAKFPAILSQYVESHVQLQETLSGGVPHLRNGGFLQWLLKRGDHSLHANARQHSQKKQPILQARAIHLISTNETSGPVTLCRMSTFILVHGAWQN